MKYLVTIENELYSSAIDSLKQSLSKFLDVPEENVFIVYGVVNMKVYSTDAGSIKMLDISL